MMLLRLRRLRGLETPVTARYRPAGSTIARMTIDPANCGVKVMVNRPLMSVVAACDIGCHGPCVLGALSKETCRPLSAGETLPERGRSPPGRMADTGGGHDTVVGR